MLLTPKKNKKKKKNRNSCFWGKRRGSVVDWFVLALLSDQTMCPPGARGVILNQAISYRFTDWAHFQASDYVICFTKKVCCCFSVEGGGEGYSVWEEERGPVSTPPHTHTHTHTHYHHSSKPPPIQATIQATTQPSPPTLPTMSPSQPWPVPAPKI